MKYTDLMRWATTLALLYYVWLNSHWSVALSITLITLNAEATAALLKILFKKLNKI